MRREIRTGDLNRALSLAEQGWSRQVSRPETNAHWEFRLLRAHILVLQGKAREVRELLAQAPPVGDAFRVHHIRRLMCLGRAHFLQADYPESRRILDEALQLAQSTDDAGLRAEVQLWRGSTLARCGEFEAADAAYREALELAARAGDEYLQAAAFGNRGFARLNGSRFDEAIPFFEETLRLARRAGAQRFYANTLGNLGRCYAGLGDFPRAAKMLAEATALLGKLGDAIAEQIWLGNLGEVHHLQHDYVSAGSCYRRALDLSRRLGTTYFTLMWLNKLTELALDAGDVDGAEAWNREALEVSPRVPTRDSGIWSRLWSARILALRGQNREAEQRYREVLASASPSEERDVIWQAHAGLALLYGASGRWAEAEHAFQRASRLLELRRTGLGREEWKLTFQARARRLYEEYVDFLMSRGKAERALEVAEASRARVLMSRLGVAAPETAAGASELRDLARRLRAVLLSYWLAPRRSFLWAVEPGRITSFVLPPDGELRPLVRAVRSAAEGMRDLAKDSEAARRLYEAVLRPVEAQLKPPVRLIIVADGPLYEINLEMLAPRDGRRYWIEDASMCLAPSLVLLVRAGSRSAPGADSLLLIGDPAIADPRFPRLPAVEREIQSIAGLFPPGARRIVTGAAARPGAYAAQKPWRFTLLHFATHAVASPENPLDSAIILAPEGENWKLYARQVMQAPLAARLVTLSACRGAGSRVFAGEGLVGFAWAFLQAGARNVIAGLWDVHDDSTAVLMGRLYANLAGGQSPAEALRNAKLSLIAARNAWSKPYYWAAFQLYTRGEFF